MKLIVGKSNERVMLTLLLLISCANISSLQTARTLQKGQDEILAGVSLNNPSYPVSDGGTILKIPCFELAYRRGFAEKADFGLQLNVPGTINIDTKYQLVDQKRWALALSAGLGWTKTFGLETIVQDSGLDIQFLDAYLPIHWSYDLNPKMVFYVSPKFLHRMMFSEGSEFNALNYVGGTSGLKFGQKTGVYLEGSYMNNISERYDLDLFQVAVAFYFQPK